MLAARVGPLESGLPCEPLVVIELAGLRESQEKKLLSTTTTTTTTAEISPVIRPASLVHSGRLAPEPAGKHNVGLKSSESSSSKLLPILDYYLTFIHYFGFSINPNDDRGPQLLSRRVKRVAAAAVASSSANERLNPGRKCRNSLPGKCESFASKLSRQHSLKLANLAPIAIQRARHHLKTIKTNWRRLLKTSVKLVAISLTTFLTMNHVIVLIDYVYRRSKALTELMLELRLVITKLSALIFVIAWHRNQSKVRLLIRLIKSTSVNILTSESPPPPPPPQDATHETDSNATNGGNELSGSCKRLNQIDKRVLKWWVLCMSVTIIHLSLSEAEIKSAHHLWEWLDDYSLHQLSNETTSNATLFAMATFDNYMYTVHVYGTRLVGSSIICIVCTFQLENITCLRRQTLNLLRAYARAPADWLDSRRRARDGRRRSSLLVAACHRCRRRHDNWPGTNCECGSMSGVAGAAHVCKNSADGDAGEQLFSLFYVLGESDWNCVMGNRRQLEPIGRLSRPLAHLWRLCSRPRLPALPGHLAPTGRQLLASSAAAIRHLGDRCAAATPSQWPASRAHGAKLEDGAAIWPTAKNGSNDRIRATPNGVPTCAPALTRADSQSVPMLRNYLNDYLARERALNLGPLRRGHERNANRNHCTRPSDWPQSVRMAPPRLPIRGGAAQLRGALQSQTSCVFKMDDNHHVFGCGGGGGRGDRSMSLGQGIELQLEALARKYELIRTVNSRIDNCFGHMLLSQYSFLFLMSCIDVVFFSLSFNPNTKTKYIIVSGMILLWLPYLLLYKYASDVGLASKELLTSVRRLARLALVLQLSDDEDHDEDDDNYDREVDCIGGVNLNRKGSRANSRTLAKHRFVAWRATILNKLDHVFEPSHLSIVGLMAMNKFFLLNFAKIVITASVMTIQFISKR